MSSSRTQPIFEPISRDLIDPVYPNNPTKSSIEKHRPIRRDLEALKPEEFDPRVPYGWGFFIYRAIFGDGTDARFSEGLNRLEKWLRWEARISRYNSDEEGGSWEHHPEYMPAAGEPDVTDEVAARMWNKVVEEYPDAQEIITEPEGSEDFSPIGRDFAARVESFDINTGPQDEEDRRRNTRYETCLIIDGRVLEMLEGLPADTPPVVPLPESSPESQEAEQILRDNWVWILDRETAIDREEGDVQEFPPWIRIRLHSLRFFFFRSALGYVTTDWQRLVEEDKNNWDTVRWWNTIAPMCNEMRRASRAAPSNRVALF
ncbi:hypothetical protein THAR02_11145 [Trichoderma harzianum]|uniref:Uncharacterized protein n=1 Tax=Trichoderma harzianum TaxID=5544 RepID=A0A0F9X7F1_TRIHA|nr:hypothetical protein THAR02_11145 [Trichoderma harzianum]